MEQRTVIYFLKLSDSQYIRNSIRIWVEKKECRHKLKYQHIKNKVKWFRKLKYNE